MVADETARAWDFDEAVAYLKSALKFGIEPSLDGIRMLTDALGAPQRSFASVQVTGTNGKTSTSRMIGAILVRHGFKVGLFTSPELVSYEERVEIDGSPVSREAFADAVQRVAEAASTIERTITEFELLTGVALLMFAEAGVDFAVLEVGMGGEWDSTSVVDPSVAVVTGVALDHQAVLGETLAEIAVQKAGIIKPASAPILGPGIPDEVLPIFLERADECDTHARLVRPTGVEIPAPEELTVRFTLREREEAAAGVGLPPAWSTDVEGLHGSYRDLSVAAPKVFAQNVATAVAAGEAALGRALDPNVTRSALRALTLPGRFERLRTDPAVVVDGSHNPQAAAALADVIAEAFPEPPLIVLGVLSDKDARGIVEALAPVAGGFVVTAPDSPRALEAESLADIVREVTDLPVHVVEPLAEALRHAIASGSSGVVVNGSLTTAGQARNLLLTEVA